MLAIIIYCFIQKMLEWDAEHWVAFATTITGVVTIGLWITAIQALRDTKRTFDKLNNAYLSIFDSPFLDRSISNENEYGIVIKYQNFGNIPAENLRTTGVLADTLDFVITRNLKLGKFESIVMPKAYRSWFIPFRKTLALDDDGTASPSKQSSKDIYDSYKDGTFKLFVRFEAHYTGIDDHRYVFYYVGQYNTDEDNFGTIKNWWGKVAECKENIAVGTHS
jgi:hypothetical protein